MGIAVGVACFILPLVGIHGRLAGEKGRLMEAANERLHVATAELYRRIDSGELAGVTELNNAVTGVTTIRTQITRLPTWPWSPDVLRGFVTALILPILIWVVTHQLGLLVQ